jgi:DNA-binding MarR family transcriptional regulator
MENSRVGALLGLLDAAGDTGARVAVLRARLALPERTVGHYLKALEDRGLIRREGRREGRRALLTAAGRAEARAAQQAPAERAAVTPGAAPSAAGARAWADALDALPAAPLRAFGRLLLCGVAARHGLRKDLGDGWGCAVALGGTGTGKTALARWVARVLGLDPSDVVRLVPHETAGSLFGRRVQAPGGAWHVEPSPVLAQPFVCLDEWDKAAPDMRQAATALLLGSARERHEGAGAVELRPHAYLTLNAGDASVLPDAVRRRAVLLDTGPLRSLLRYRIDAAVRDLLDADLPRLRLDRLNVKPLSQGAFSELRRRLVEGLTPEGWDLSDVEGVARLAAGRVALGMEPGASAAATAADYLTCAATWGGARADANPEEAELLLRAALDARIAQASAALDLTRTRTERLAELRRLATALAAEAESGSADPTVKALRLSARRVKAAATRADMDAEWEAAAEDRETAQETLRAWAEEDAAEERRAEEAERIRAAAEQARRQQVAQAAAQRRAAQEQARRASEAQRSALAPMLEAARAQAASLGRLVRRTDPWGGLLELGVVQRAPDPAGGGLWAKLAGPSYVDWLGRKAWRDNGPELAREAHAAAKEAVAALRAGRLPGVGALAAVGIGRAPLSASPAPPALPRAAGAPYPPKPRVGGLGRGPGGV